MIKKISVIVISLSFALSAYSQDTLQKKVRSEIGVNASLFVKTFISLGNNNPGILSPYAFTYKLINKKSALRVGIGGSYSSVVQTDVSSGTTPNDVKVTTTTFDTRLGGELQRPLGKKWLAYFGWDFLYGYEDNITSSEGTRITTKTNALGTGPVMGIAFYITPKVSLFTEASIYGKSMTSISTQTFDDVPEFSNRTDSNENQVQFNIPVSIFLAITL